ncbi:hypothetical protein V8C86DRAFT_740231 [Haematococcus lacustris]
MRRARLWLSVGLLVAICLTTMPAIWGAPVETRVVQVDGSGTSNHAPLVWRVLETLRARTKPMPSLTYRSVGSGAGQSDMAVNSSVARSSFGCGDFPLTSSQWRNASASGNPVLHFPVLVGSISVFHSLPGVAAAAGGLQLSPCTLSAIFQGRLTQWDDPRIAAENPRLVEGGLLPAGQAIRVVRRADGSSSTYALSTYLAKANSSCWQGPSGPTISSWAAGNTVVGNSQAMVTALLGNELSIGYVESGQGLAAGLKEVAVANQAGYLNSNSPSTVILSPDVLQQVLPQGAGGVDPTADWGNVSLILAPGQNVWPLTLVTFFYLRADLSWQGQAGGLTRQVVAHFLSDEVAALMPAYGFLPLAQATRTQLLAALSTQVSLDPAAVPWQVELTTNNAFGQGDWVVSSLRDSHVMRTLTALSGDVGTALASLRQGNDYQVHGGGSFLAAPWLRGAMSTLQGRSRLPIAVTYRVTGTPEAQAEFMDWTSSVANYNNFKVGELPLSTAQYTTFLATHGGASQARGVLHLPLAAASVSLFFNQQLPGFSLTLNPCLTAQLYQGKVTRWSDPTLAQANNFNASLPSLGFPITVFAYAGPSSSTFLLSAWLSKACPGVWQEERAATLPTPGSPWAAAVTSRFQGNVIRSPEDMAAAIAGTPRSIGYLPSRMGLERGLSEALLQPLQGGPLTSSQADLTQVITTLLPSLPPTMTESWAAVDATGLPGRSWPLTCLVYAYCYKDLTAFNATGPLTKALLTFLLSGEGQQQMAAMGLAPLPASLLARTQAALKLVSVAPLLAEWSFEPQGLASPAGMSLFSFSANRASAETMAANAAATQSNQVQAALSARLPLVLSLAGPQAADLGALMRRMLDDLMAFATKPIRLNFEAAAPGEDLALRLQPGAAANFTAATHGLVLDQPLTTSQWSGLTNAGVQVLQLPLLVRPLALTYLGSTRSTPLRMAPCNLARLMRGEMTSWNDPQLQADNPDLRLPAKPIRLVLPGGPEAAGWRALLSPAWAELYSSLGVQQAVLLPVGAAAGGWVSATQFLPQAYSAQLQYLYERGQLPRDPSADWSGVSLAGQASRPGSAPLYPLIS